MSLDAIDILVSTSIGAMCGAVDSVFVGSADKGYSNTQSSLGVLSDDGYEALVRSFAKFNGWKPSEGGEGDTLAAIKVLEDKFKVAYDQHRSDVVDFKVKLSPSSHHYYQPGHSPDLLGLLTAIADELDGKATFFQDGKIVRVSAASLFADEPIPARVAKIAWRWFGHVLSDVSGSSGSGNRGMGLPAPFISALQKCDFTHLDPSELNAVLEKTYENGYDLRFATATAVPVILEETLVRAFWVIRRHFQYDRPLGECAKEILPGKAPDELKWMLVISNGALCTVDLGDAAVHASPKKDPVAFVSRLSYAAWVRFAMLAISLVADELGEAFGQVMAQLQEQAMLALDEYEQAKVDAYRLRMLGLVKTCEDWSSEAIALMEEEAEAYLALTTSLTSEELPVEAKAYNSVTLANVSGAEPITDLDELDAFMEP